MSFAYFLHQILIILLLLFQINGGRGTSLLIIYYVLLIVCSLVLIAGFTVHPSSVIQAKDAMARFDCQTDLEQAIDIKWSIGGVFLSQYHPTGVIAQRRGQSSWLSVPAVTQYNRTVIQCKVIDSSLSNELSKPAYLTVQGT